MTCLFVVKIGFFCLEKVLRNGILVMGACVGMFAAAATLITPSPVVTPHWVYNADSALYYIIFYALGYYGFPLMHGILSCDRTWKKIVCACAGVLSLLYSAVLFFGRNLLGAVCVNGILITCYPILTALIVICCVLLVSRLIGNAGLLEELGKNTLYLCGSEYLITLLLPTFLQLIGLRISIVNHIAAYIYAFVLLLACNYVLVPAEKAIFKRVNLLKNSRQ